LLRITPNGAPDSRDDFSAAEEGSLMAPVKVGEIFNRVEKDDEDLEKIILETGLEYYCSLKPDPAISELDRLGISQILTTHPFPAVR
jgi:hypothetical protein